MHRFIQQRRRERERERERGREPDCTADARYRYSYVQGIMCGREHDGRPSEAVTRIRRCLAPSFLLPSFRSAASGGRNGSRNGQNESGWTRWMRRGRRPIRQLIMALMEIVCHTRARAHFGLIFEKLSCLSVCLRLRVDRPPQFAPWESRDAQWAPIQRRRRPRAINTLFCILGRSKEPPSFFPPTRGQGLRRSAPPIPLFSIACC